MTLDQTASLPAALLEFLPVRNIPVRAWLLALLSSGLQILIFPKTSFYFLSWVALAPLLYALLRGRGGAGELVDSEGRTLRPFTVWQGFLLGWFNGVLWYLGMCYWVYPVMHGYGHVDAFSSVLITLAFCLVMGLHHGAFGFFVVLLARRSSFGNRRPLMLAPFFWVAIEFFRERATPVFWEPLGNSQADNIPFARIAQLTGVYGLSFAIMLVNSAFVAAMLLRGKQRRNLLLTALTAAIALQIGVLARPAPAPAAREAVLLQHNAPVLDAPWTQDYADQTLRELAQLSMNALPPHPPGSPGLIVWPESPAPFIVGDRNFQTWLAEIARSTNSYLVIGSTTLDQELRGQPPGSPAPMYNSALVVDPSGRPLGRYDKIHLVPFGEYVPMRDLLFFASKLTREVGDFSRGTERFVFDLNGAKIGVFICYESIYPSEVRQFAANGAQVLINISDDGWFGNTGAPFHHLQMGRMRAIENHRWVLISTNSGITASVDPDGRVVTQAPRNVRTALVAPFNVENEVTFYTRFGDVFAWICVVISILAIIVRWRFKARTMIEAPTT
ncbi:MAG TPA: apolipoprotein N-acyltransferase [Candidatus Angelobacter sp.]|nr:apolipoprotein N-acyltransferase [Candidatus Angelobacter sp.]